tara:strand:- start:1152 stop:2888 length:1737 start_codon:yes stop_codon:yes gene_type:complete
MAQFDNVKFELLGESEGVRDWQGLQIIATFDNDNNQPNITTSELTFSLDMGKKLIEHIDNGSGIFQGVDFEMFLNTPSTDVFKGILDLADDIEVNREKQEVKAKLLKLDGLNTFANVSEAITMGLLESEGKFTSSDYVDIPYVKETEFDYLATAILIVSIFQIQAQLKAIFREKLDLTADSGGETAGSLSTGLLGAGVIGFGKGAAKIIYFAAMFYILLDMIKQLFDILFPIVKYHRGIKLKTILKKGCEFAGYEFSSTITELDDLYILPRKTEAGRRNIPNAETGLPVSGGPLYTLGKCVGLVKDLFNAKVKITDNNKVHIEPLNNRGFWELDSAYEMPPIKVDIDKYNTNELVGTKVISFTIDNDNYWDLDNYKGTSYEIKTLPKAYDDFKKVLIKGVSELTFPVALGTRKTEESLLERTFRTFANIADSLSVIFKSNNDFTGKVDRKAGMLRMSTDLVNIPKALRLTPTLKLEKNHRDIWSAKYLYEKYHYVNSFVKDIAKDQYNQYKVYQKIKMNASFEDFLKIINNNIATDEDGNRVVFDSILYNFGGGYWEADYKIQYQYTTNLKETYTEPT